MQFNFHTRRTNGSAGFISLYSIIIRLTYIENTSRLRADPAVRIEVCVADCTPVSQIFAAGVNHVDELSGPVRQSIRCVREEGASRVQSLNRKIHPVILFYPGNSIHSTVCEKRPVQFSSVLTKSPINLTRNFWNDCTQSGSCIISFT